MEGKDKSETDKLDGKKSKNEYWSLSFVVVTAASAFRNSCQQIVLIYS